MGSGAPATQLWVDAGGHSCLCMVCSDVCACVCVHTHTHTCVFPPLGENSLVPETPKVTRNTGHVGWESFVPKMRVAAETMKRWYLAGNRLRPTPQPEAKMPPECEGKACLNYPLGGPRSTDNK